ncbi:hypothetical protein P4V39_24690 [Brevibacillus borstelensis]|uniref:hypothetical protein n=2 Tax=Brevibacillus TaxID=55080 RepID=UPI002E1FC191|nr:hypothetical protein [Brevibacillus borstelensis]
MMSLFEQFRKKGVTITAAVYISINENLDSVNAEKEVGKQLQDIFKFINRNTGIIIIESYVDRDGSTREWNRLLEDIQTERYRVVLTCGSWSERETIEVPIIDVLET